MNEAPLPLFVYGTLTDPHVRERLLGRRCDLEVIRALLRDYARVSVPGVAYPFVAPEVGGAVDGMAIFGLIAADYAVLDEYEDVPGGLYARTLVDVELLGCGTSRAVRAWVYARGPGIGRQAPVDR